MIIYNGTTHTDGAMNSEDTDGLYPVASNFCRDYIKGCCSRASCRFLHELPPRSFLKELFRFCHDYQNKGCFRQNCKFLHSTVEEEERFYATGEFPRDPRNISPTCQACPSQDCKLIHNNDIASKRNIPPPMFDGSQHSHIRDEDLPPEAKFRRFAYGEVCLDNQTLQATQCQNCESLDHKVKLLHDNISVLLKKVADLTAKNAQLTSMNEFLLEQTSSYRSDQPCVITSRHGTSAPLATVSVTPVVSLAGGLPTLVPATANTNLTLAPAASQAQLLTPAPQILTVSTTQQLMGNSGALIVTSAGAQQLMQVSDSGTLMGGGQTVVAVTPAQLTLAPPGQQLMSNGQQLMSTGQQLMSTGQQLMSSGPQNAVQQLVQTSALQSQLAPQHQAPQYAAAQQSVQHLAAAQQSAQRLAAQQSAQHLAAQQSAQHLAQSAQHLAAAQQSAQQLAAAAQQSAQQMVAQQSAQQLAAQQSAQQQLVHQTSTQQITISSTSQPMALPNSQAQPLTFPIISQSILPH